MASIESLNAALEKYTGTLIFVSHDREFVSSLATRVVEMKPEGIIDFKGNYENYLRSEGIFSDGANLRGNSPTAGKEKVRASSR